MVKVAVVGAGVSGLAAARRLGREQVGCVIFERDSIIGGRVQTRREAGFVVDYGAQFFTPRGMKINETLLHELATDDLVQLTKPIFLLEGSRVSAGSDGKNSQPRYTYRGGAHRLCELLSEGLDIRLNSGVSEIIHKEGGMVIGDDLFDAVILTGTLPDMEPILRADKDRRRMLMISYRPCISVSMGFDAEPPQVPYFGLLSADRRTPILWLGIENGKCEDRAPEGKTLITTQFGPEYSDENFSQPDSRLLATAAALTARLYGEEFATPSWNFIHRWHRSQPERVALFENVNPEGCRILLAGDGTLAGRVENAFEVGVWAAERVLRLIR